ncbi:ApeP family dehydratase [Pseudoalteromonas sp. UCD-33C]|uniref:ApeP family dehydratase n=1 Tax=Pseudoalteromonas sp. UCD-33C TaxID=1716175 RepID=UPI0006CA2183|nr:hotdog family protein [Pseudoalteromonas sp. UCD-33C]KPM77356.1 3-hydroxylacyl-ACP dehydratase [Pseudoalteromonas sp. UCD-33C]
MNRYKIEQVVPHSEPMILLNRLSSYSEESGCCEVDISSQSPFYDESLNGVASYIGCEYMAQTIAAYAGALAKDKGNEVQIGFLIGTRKYKTYAPVFKNEQTLKVSVTKLYQEESGLSVFECQIHSDETCLAEAKINVFQPQDPMQFIRENQ